MPRANLEGATLKGSIMDSRMGIHTNLEGDCLKGLGKNYYIDSIKNALPLPLLKHLRGTLICRSQSERCCSWQQSDEWHQPSPGQSERCFSSIVQSTLCYHGRNWHGGRLVDKHMLNTCFWKAIHTWEIFLEYNCRPIHSMNNIEVWDLWIIAPLHCSLCCTCTQNCDLVASDLQHANLRGANIRGTNLQDVII